MRQLGLFVFVMLFGLQSVYAGIGFRKEEEDPDEPKWQEEEVVLPTFPREENLLEFYVSAVAGNRFFIDGSSIAVGADGVVRFAMVVKTTGGATNVTYEGLRCKMFEYRLYATGRADGTWSKARASEWKPIENKPVNRQHAALNRDYFCPSTLPIGTPEEGRAAIKRGGHPDAK